MTEWTSDNRQYKIAIPEIRQANYVSPVIALTLGLEALSGLWHSEA